MSTSITLQQLQYFLSAVKYGSLSAAAEAHFIAQPSLSEQIRRLESSLGVSLFTRTNRRLILTDAARMLIPYAERTIRAAEEAAAAVDPVRDLTGGTIAFGTFSSGPYLIHTDLIAQFRALHPQVRVRLVTMNSVQVADAVRDGELEAGLVALPVDDRGLAVGGVEWVSEAVFMSRSKDRTAVPMTMHDLARCTLILHEVNRGNLDPMRRQLLAATQSAGVTLDPIIEVESPVTALELAERGVGDTVIPLPVAEALGATRRLHHTPLSPRLLETFAFVHRRDAHLSPATEVLIRLARRLLADLPTPSPR